MNVISFPTAARARRAYVLQVARAALPLLEAASEAGDATLIEKIFDGLGAVARGEDALGVLEAVRFGDAEIIPLRGAR